MNTVALSMLFLAFAFVFATVALLVLHEAITTFLEREAARARIEAGRLYVGLLFEASWWFDAPTKDLIQDLARSGDTQLWKVRERHEQRLAAAKKETIQ